MAAKINMQTTEEFIANGVSFASDEDLQQTIDSFKRVLDRVLDEDGSVTSYRDCGDHYEVEMGGANVDDVRAYEHEITNAWFERCCEIGF